MKPKGFVLFVDVLVVGLIAFSIGRAVIHRKPAAGPREFARQVDLKPLEGVAVHTDGRIKSFDSFARTIVRYIAGSKAINGQDPAFSYLDLMLNADNYNARPIIYAKKQIRKPLISVMQSMGVDEKTQQHFRETGMITPELIESGPIADELARLDQDLMRTSKFVGMVNSARVLSDQHELAARMKIIPPPGGDAKTAWFAGYDLWGFAGLHDGHDHGAEGGQIPGMAQEKAAALVKTWNDLAAAWHAEDAPKVNEAVAQLASEVRNVEPKLYPPLDKLRLEAWYFKWHAFTWNWITYIFAVVPLLITVIYRWRKALWLGVFILLIAFGIHTASLGIRWEISGRIPNSNMFEAILASSWFGIVCSFILEFLARKTAMRGVFFLGFSVYAMVAMMCQNFMPTTLTSDIDNVMPVLNDLWLYIHTNVIIFSYALVAMGCISALLYLRYRANGGDPKVAKVGGAGSLILDGAGGKGSSFLRENPATFGMMLDAATMVIMELAFIMLWTGLVMGAIWADHSWGRPWGWDPKEVFALCTFVIFLLLVHVRFKVRDKGLWTAILAVVGCGVMLFNWIIINFKISGLHSYA